MKVNVEYIIELKEELNKINKIPLNEIKFVENGEVLDIPENIVDDFEFTCLANIDFILTDFYKTGFEDIGD
jgi:hypothetical protein